MVVKHSLNPAEEDDFGVCVGGFPIGSGGIVPMSLSFCTVPCEREVLLL